MHAFPVHIFLAALLSINKLSCDPIRNGANFIRRPHHPNPLGIQRPNNLQPNGRVRINANQRIDVGPQNGFRHHIRNQQNQQLVGNLRRGPPPSNILPNFDVTRDGAQRPIQKPQNRFGLPVITSGYASTNRHGQNTKNTTKPDIPDIPADIEEDVDVEETSEDILNGVFEEDIQWLEDNAAEEDEQHAKLHGLKAEYHVSDDLDAPRGEDEQVSPVGPTVGDMSGNGEDVKRGEATVTIEEVPAHHDDIFQAPSLPARSSLENVDEKSVDTGTVNVFIPPIEESEETNFNNGGHFVPDPLDNDDGTYHPGYEQIDVQQAPLGDRYSIVEEQQNWLNSKSRRTHPGKSAYPLGRPITKTDLVHNLVSGKKNRPPLPTRKINERPPRPVTPKPSASSFFDFLIPSFIRGAPDTNPPPRMPTAVRPPPDARRPHFRPKVPRRQGPAFPRRGPEAASPNRIGVAASPMIQDITRTKWIRKPSGESTRQQPQLVHSIREILSKPQHAQNIQKNHILNARRRLFGRKKVTAVDIVTPRSEYDTRLSTLSGYQVISSKVTEKHDEITSQAHGFSVESTTPPGLLAQNINRFLDKYLFAYLSPEVDDGGIGKPANSVDGKNYSKLIREASGNMKGQHLIQADEPVGNPPPPPAPATSTSSFISAIHSLFEISTLDPPGFTIKNHLAKNSKDNSFIPSLFDNSDHADDWRVLSMVKSEVNGSSGSSPPAVLKLPRLERFGQTAEMDQTVSGSEPQSKIAEAGFMPLLSESLEDASRTPAQVDIDHVDA